eukprot:s588_g26.t1
MINPEGDKSNIFAPECDHGIQQESTEGRGHLSIFQTLPQASTDHERRSLYLQRPLWNGVCIDANIERKGRLGPLGTSSKQPPGSQSIIIHRVSLFRLEKRQESIRFTLVPRSTATQQNLPQLGKVRSKGAKKKTCKPRPDWPSEYGSPGHVAG